MNEKIGEQHVEGDVFEQESTKPESSVSVPRSWEKTASTESMDIEIARNYVYNKILQIYPFTSTEEQDTFIKGSAEIQEAPTLASIGECLKLLNNPHAAIRELQPKDKSIYPSFPPRPEGLLKNESYGIMLENVLYLDIPSWSYKETSDETISAKLSEVINEYSPKAQGYIIDLRKNQGGNEKLARDVAQHFMQQGDYVYGRQLVKDPEGNLVEDNFTCTFHSNNPEPIDEHVVLLTSPSTFSTCERFIALMRLRENVTIIGSETAGGSAGAEIIRVRAEDKEYSVAIPRWRFYLPGETLPIEDTKIKPDIYFDPKSPEIINFALNYIKTTKQKETDK